MAGTKEFPESPKFRALTNRSHTDILGCGGASGWAQKKKSLKHVLEETRILVGTSLGEPHPECTEKGKAVSGPAGGLGEQRLPPPQLSLGSSLWQ